MARTSTLKLPDSTAVCMEIYHKGIRICQCFLYEYAVDEMKTKMANCFQEPDFQIMYRSLTPAEIILYVQNP